MLKDEDEPKSLIRSKQKFNELFDYDDKPLDVKGTNVNVFLAQSKKSEKFYLIKMIKTNSTEDVKLLMAQFDILDKTLLNKYDNSNILKIAAIY